MLYTILLQIEQQQAADQLISVHIIWQNENKVVYKVVYKVLYKILCKVIYKFSPQVCGIFYTIQYDFTAAGNNTSFYYYVFGEKKDIGKVPHFL